MRCWGGLSATDLEGLSCSCDVVGAGLGAGGWGLVVSWGDAGGCERICGGWGAVRAARHPDSLPAPGDSAGRIPEPRGHRGKVPHASHALLLLLLLVWLSLT